MDRLKYLALLNEKISNKNTVKHSIAVEAVMKALARHFGEDEEIWAMAGLLHDLDYEVTANDWTKHGEITAQWLKNENLPAEVIRLIKAHNADATGMKLESKGEKAIFAADPVTGLITAAALMTPEKKLADLSVQSVMKKFKNKKFAAGCNRESISVCEQIDLPLEKFIEISLKAMQSVSDELGL